MTPEKKRREYLPMGWATLEARAIGLTDSSAAVLKVGRTADRIVKSMP
jgi:hypothetical protein